MTKKRKRRGWIKKEKKKEICKQIERSEKTKMERRKKGGRKRADRNKRI